MTRSFDVPVLMLVFNRPEKTRRVFEAVRACRPARLLVAADGPRADHPDDAERCRATREIFEAVDWPCSVDTLFRDANVGCKRGVEEGITWFFSKVDQGIILEDDCIPDPSFFEFCSELLARYRDDGDVMMISGTNALGRWDAGGHSYLFSRQYEIWGWATWRRAWDHYDPKLSRWPEPGTQAKLRSMMQSSEFRAWKGRIDSVYNGTVDTWDWGWTLALLLADGVTAIPVRNLVSNIGFDAEATHTRNEWSDKADLPASQLRFPLDHPPDTSVDEEYDHQVYLQDNPLSARLAAMLPPSVERPARAAFYKLTSAMPRR